MPAQSSSIHLKSAHMHIAALLGSLHSAVAVHSAMAMHSVTVLGQAPISKGCMT